MFRVITLIAPAVVLAAAPAAASEKARTGTPVEAEWGEASGPPSLVKTSVSGDYTSFTKGKGSRRLVGAEYIHDAGATSFVLGVTQGERDFGKGKKSYSGVRLSASVGHDWSSRVSTVTTVLASDSSPVFERVRAQQDVDFKLVGGTVLRLGGRYSRFAGGVEVGAASAGVTQYFGGGFLSYRLSAFDVAGRGTSFAHLASFQLKDPRGKGSTQLWVGHGSSLHELDWMPDMQTGRLTSLTVKRSQPLGKHVGLSLSLGRTWYDRPLGQYRGTKVGLGLSFRR